MEERYNPMKSAEIATEHNYNMLDGVLNNQAPPPEEKELDKVKEPPHKRRSRERRNDDKETPSPDPSPCDGVRGGAGLIQQRMAETGIRNMGAYMRKMASMAMCSMLTSRPSGSWYRSSGGAQTTSIKWRSRRIPTVGFTPRRSPLCNGTMPPCGGRCPIC